MLKSIRQLIMSLRVFLAIKQYCKQKKIYCKINSLFNKIKISRNFSSLYFIIVLKKSNYKTKVNHIRRKKEKNIQVVLLTSEVDYNYIFKNHLELLGIINLSANYSYTYLLEMVKDYIDTFLQ
mgnify:FL=1